jgi:diacylglycerol O-acyltransferase / wax synthase
MMDGESSTGFERMDPLDALMFRSDGDPGSRSTMLGMYVLDERPDWDRVVETFERTSRLVPRLRQRVGRPAVLFGSPYWVGDEHFDLSYHVRHVKLSGEANLRDLLDFAQLFASSPLDRSRPLWEATLVEGLDSSTAAGQAALLLKSSHSIADGVTAMEMAMAMLTSDPDTMPDSMPPLPLVPGVARLDLTRDAAREMSNAAYLRSSETYLGAARLAVGAVLHPVSASRTALRSVRTGTQVARSLATSLVLDRPRPSALLRERGYRRRLCVIEAPLADLRRVARSAGGTLNDTYLAGLVGGLRRYHDKLNSPIDAISIAVPVALRRDDADAGGNNFGAALVAAPVKESDPVARIGLIHDLILAQRHEPAVNLMHWVAPVGARLPDSIVQAMTAQVMRHDVQASSIPGLPGPVYFAGSQVVRFYPFGPAPRVAAMTVMVPYAGVCTIGVNVDLAAVQEPVLFEACLEESFAELVAIGRAL